MLGSQPILRVRRLLFDNLTNAEKKAYLCALDNKLLSDDAYFTARFEGNMAGREEGREEEREKVVINCHLSGYQIDAISTITGLTPEPIIEMLNRRGLI